MPTVSVIEILKTEKKSQYLSDMELAGVPSVNDKITFDKNGTGYIFNVVDAQYAIKSRVDVFVERINNITDYNAGRFSVLQ